MAKDIPPQALADAIDEMLANRTALAELSARAKNRFHEKYTLHACHERLFEVFKKISNPK